MSQSSRRDDEPRPERLSEPPTTESLQGPSEPVDEPPAGMVLDGRYVLDEQIGAGRWTSVWRSRDTELQRQVAVKVVGGLGEADDRVLDRFHREAVAVAQLEHRNVVRLYDFGRQDRLHYLVMEHVAGGSVKDADPRRPEPEVVAAVGCQAAAGLGAVHDHGLVHRDIKPSNLLICRGGPLKLSDFGIARRLYRATTLNSDDGLLGTARYLAPEQVEGQSAVPASDVYALGLVLWELWTGQAAFRGDTMVATALARVYQDLPPPGSIREGIPDGLESAIGRATARPVDVRFSSGHEFHGALADVAGPRPRQPVAALMGDDRNRSPRGEQADPGRANP